ncbi:arabinose transporter [Moraxella bovoculi 237]|uniref:Arabinose transporter n=1 Tax=Moraxella bovoculi 237 TaxID=743974 RepID=A0A066UE59_9GAMM|nr:sugar transporter [Moraxella bovoculi]KDN25390.1 arabinose transporter [Moraxella bovoculi 237]
MLTTTQIDRLRTYRVMLLAFAAFIFNTTEYIPIALLSDIGTSFSMPVDKVGIMMTVYAWIVALVSLPLMLATAKIERKRLLVGVFTLFVASHILSAVATSFGVLLIARTGVALAHAIFWSITASLVVRLAAKDKRTKALGLLATGSALAAVLGLPIGRLVGQYLGWRASFALIGVLALICLVILWKILPNLPSRNVGNIKSLPDILKNTPLLLVYLMIILIVTAHFTAYSYIEPFMLNVVNFSANFATWILLMFGLAGIVASILFGRYYERMERSFLWLAMMAIALGLSTLFLFSDMSALWVINAFLWGIGATTISLVLQIQVLRLAPKATDVAMSIFSGIFNIGIGGGALLGGIVIAQMSLIHIGHVGAAVALLAMLAAWAYTRRLA